MIYAVRFCNNCIIETCKSLDDAIYLKNRVCGVNEIYYAHTEKKGYNTIVVLDGLVRKSDGTPL